MSEIASALHDLQTANVEFKTTLQNDLKALRKAHDDLETRHERLMFNGGLPATGARSSGHGWLDVKAVTVGSDPGGGYLVPDNYSDVLIDALRPEAVLLRAGARVFTTDAAVLHFPGVSSDPIARWRGELQQLTSSAPAYRRVTATPRKLQAFTVASNESLADSRPEIARVLEAQMAAQLALGLDHAVFHGQAEDAAAAPIPFRDVDGIQTATTLGNDGSVPGDLWWLSEAISKLLQVNGRLDRSALFVSPRTFGSLLELEEATDSNKPLLWTQQTIDAGPVARLFGVPVFVSSTLPDDLTRGSSNNNTSTAWLIDMASVYVVIRSGTRIEIDRSVFFDRDATALRATMRADVQLAHPELAIQIPGFKVS